MINAEYSAVIGLKKNPYPENYDWAHTKRRVFRPITALFSALSIKPRTEFRQTTVQTTVVVDPSQSKNGFKRPVLI
jgi:hypothetical protein